MICSMSRASPTGKIRLRREIIDVAAVLDRARDSAQPADQRAQARPDLSLMSSDLSVGGRRSDPARANRPQSADERGEIHARRRLHRAFRAEVATRRFSSRSATMASASRPDRLPEMFRLFAQGERSIARSEGGLGIGLTIVEKLVGMHGGRIEAKSEGIEPRQHVHSLFPRGRQVRRSEPQRPTCRSQTRRGDAC